MYTVALCLVVLCTLGLHNDASEALCRFCNYHCCFTWVYDAVKEMLEHVTCEQFLK